MTGHPRASVLLRLPPANVSLTPEVRCAVVGNVDSGKSTTLGVLTRGMFFFSLSGNSFSIDSRRNHKIGALDDGRGRARVGLFRHKHEIETGRTSSVGMEVWFQGLIMQCSKSDHCGSDTGVLAFWASYFAKYSTFSRSRRDPKGETWMGRDHPTGCQGRVIHW